MTLTTQDALDAWEEVAAEASFRASLPVLLDALGNVLERLQEADAPIPSEPVRWTASLVGHEQGVVVEGLISKAIRNGDEEKVDEILKNWTEQQSPIRVRTLRSCVARMEVKKTKIGSLSFPRLGFSEAKRR